MPYQDIFDSRIYKQAEQVSDMVWEVANTWSPFARETIGKQFVTAADSIGANIAESAGRFYPLDVIRFLHIARGSVRETQHWSKRALQRTLVTTTWHDTLAKLLQDILLSLNSYIKFQRSRIMTTPKSTKASPKQTKERKAVYITTEQESSDTDILSWPDI
jgi:four helix bundle protein